MKLKVENIEDLCAAAKMLGNGAASGEAIAALIAAAKETSLDKLLKVMVARARRDAEKYEEPALKLERWARIAGLTGADSDFRRTVDLIPEIRHRCARARAKKLTVQAYLAAGKMAEAKAFARAIKSAYWGAESWVEVTKESRVAHDLEQAKAYCKNIGDPLAREEVEAQIKALRM